MFRSLTARIAWSHILLAVTVNVLLLSLVQFSIERSYLEGVDVVLRDIERSADAGGDLSTEYFESIDSGPEQDNSFQRAVAPDGTILIETGVRRVGEHPVVEAARVEARVGRGELRSFSLDGEYDFRLLTRKFQDGTTLQGGFFVEKDPPLSAAIRRIGSIGVLLLSVLAAGFGWISARAAMRGVNEVTDTAQRILEGKSEARVSPTHTVPEVTRLATTFNRMLDRIDRLITDVKDVTTNVAHDLRTPLARIRSQTEVTLSGPQELDAYRATAAQTIEEAVFLDGLLETMLEVASLEARSIWGSQEDIDLDVLVSDTVELFEDAAETRGLELRLERCEAYSVVGNQRVLRRAVSNLLDNAIKFTPEGGSITVDLAREGEDIVISVCDSGPGIDEPQRERVTERFYRSDSARQVPGQGLGLAYTKAATEALGGGLKISRSPMGGARFDIRLKANLRGAGTTA